MFYYDSTFKTYYGIGYENGVRNIYRVSPFGLFLSSYCQDIIFEDNNYYGIFSINIRPRILETIEYEDYKYFDLVKNFILTRNIELEELMPPK